MDDALEGGCAFRELNAATHPQRLEFLQTQIICARFFMEILGPVTQGRMRAIIHGSSAVRDILPAGL
nr:hypothetical protein [Desulfobacula sp.]